MTLADSIKSDPTVVFLNTDDFAEAVTYLPHRYHGDPLRASRPITASVHREELIPMDEVGGVSIPVWHVHVHNNVTTGITSSELDLRNDQISLPPRDGETAEAKLIYDILFQDAGMLVLECR